MDASGPLEGEGKLDTNALVQETLLLVEGMEHIKEDARKLYRYMKRTEVLVTDLRPYAKRSAVLSVALSMIENELSAVKRMLEDCASKGKMAAYMQADHMLGSFTLATQRIDAALGQLPIDAMKELQDTANDVNALRAMLQKASFELPEGHEAVLVKFRGACDAVKGHADALEECCKDILQHVCGERSLTRSEYCAAVGDLQREIRTMRAYAVAAAVEFTAGGGNPTAAAAAEGANQQHGTEGGGGGGAAAPAAGATSGSGAANPLQGREPWVVGADTMEAAEVSAYYLRVLLDVIRCAHDVEDENVPLEFLCPLSTLIMHDPVVLMESGHSFERQALLDWWANGHRMCPKTGIPLRGKTLMIAPNVQLKEAIHRWAEGGDMALRFRPLLRLLSTASDSNNLLQPVLNAAAARASVSDDITPSAFSTGRMDTVGSIPEDGVPPETPNSAPAAAGAPAAPTPQVVGGGSGGAAVQRASVGGGMGARPPAPANPGGNGGEGAQGAPQLSAVHRVLHSGIYQQQRRTP